MAGKAKRWPRVLGVLAAIVAGFYLFAFGFGVEPTGNWTLDMAAVRALAQSVPGSKATAIQVEAPVKMKFPNAFFAPRRGFGMRPMLVASYQVVFPESTGIIDTAMLTAEGMPGAELDVAARDRMSEGLRRAGFIVVTHEHMDHLGGLVAQPDLPKLLKVAKLTLEQVSHPELLSPAKFPEGALNGYQPLQYDRMTAIAPGVVLIRAAGHTPGSQIVYVQRADGEEFLFVGDVAWIEDNVAQKVERPQLVHYMTHEDRGVVQRQLEELDRVRLAEPKVHFVYGHDPNNLAALESAGLITSGFSAKAATEPSIPFSVKPMCVDNGERIMLHAMIEVTYSGKGIEERAGTPTMTRRNMWDLSCSRETGACEGVRLSLANASDEGVSLLDTSIIKDARLVSVEGNVATITLGAPKRTFVLDFVNHKVRLTETSDDYEGHGESACPKLGDKGE